MICWRAGKAGPWRRLGKVWSWAGGHPESPSLFVRNSAPFVAVFTVRVLLTQVPAGEKRSAIPKLYHAVITSDKNPTVKATAVTENPIHLTRESRLYTGYQRQFRLHINQFGTLALSVTIFWSCSKSHYMVFLSVVCCCGCKRSKRLIDLFIHFKNTGGEFIVSWPSVLVRCITWQQFLLPLA